MSVFAKVCPRSALSKILFSPEVEIFRTPLEENGVTLWSWSEETGIICSVTEIKVTSIGSSGRFYR